MNFVDVSNHQSSIDLSRIDSAAFIFKATEGRGWRDKALPGFVNKARRLDKPVGFYHFVSQNNTPEAEAQNFLDYTAEVGRLDADLLILDWEPIGTAPAPTDTAWARRWLDYVTARVPNPVWIYCNLSTARNGRWGDLLDRFPLWLAHYPGDNRANGYNPAGAMGVPAGWRVDAWQFTDRGRLDGFAGNLDLNKLFRPWWGETASTPTPPKKEEPVLTTLPTIREADPKVWIETPKSMNRKGGWGCICMQLTLPLIEKEMIRRGLIKEAIDVFQFGYNAGGVAASAGTHDMGGVIDVAQGITKAEREVWAEFGVMMFPRIPAYGWHTGDHGHGVWHGCVHRTASAAKQVRDGINGRDGLVSNKLRNFVAPKRTWQDAYRATVSAAPTLPPVEPAPVVVGDRPTAFEETVMLGIEGTDWTLVRPEVFPPQPFPVVYDVGVVVSAPDGVDVDLRVVAWHGKSWYRYPSVRARALSLPLWTHGPGIPVHVDVRVSEPCDVEILQLAHVRKR